MEYDEFSKEELLLKLEELEVLNAELLKEKEHEKNLEFGWKGNLGHWYWNVKTNHVTFNERKITNLGYAKEEIPEHVSYQFFTKKLHPDDYQKVMNCMSDHLSGSCPAYEVEYRIRAKDGSYRWYYDRGKVMEYDRDGKPLLVAGIVFDISETKKMEEEYYTLAVKDPLTNVYNRRYFMEQLSRKVEKQKPCACEKGEQFCIAMLDVDNFKQINDSFNHHYGDFILQRITCAMLGVVRHDSVIARWGGDEFVICMEGMPKDRAEKTLERLRKQVSRIRLPDKNRVTVSIGLAEFRQEETVEELLERADTQLYFSKEKGKNCIS